MADLSYNAFQSGSTPQPQSFLQKNVTQPISDAFSSGINQASAGYNKALGAAKNPSLLGGIGQAFSGATDMILGAGNAIASPLAPILQRPAGAAVNAASNTISDNPTVQKFASSPAGGTAIKFAQGINTGANLLGTVGGAMAGGEAVSNIWDKAYSGPSALDAATSARNSAATEGVNNLNQMTEQVGQYKSNLGTNFKAGAQAIEQANPTAKLNLSSEQLDALQTLKNNKSFALPDYLKKDYTPNELGDIHTHGSLTPTQAQDLITQLNKSTFTEKSSGLGVDQTKIGLTNEIKQAASQSFGPEWNKVYSTYAKGANAVDSIHDIVNLKSDATPMDINKSLNNILKLNGTPEGKIILQNAVDDFKNTSGIDLTNPTQAIGKILESEENLKNAGRPGILKQAFNPTYLARLGVRIVAMSTIGYLLRNQISGAIKSLSGN